MNRDNSIDFFRGLAAISIVLIHTVFHSGNAYVPANVSGWFLLFDIPIFVYLSGVLFKKTKNPYKKIKEILNLILKWTIFVALCYIVLLLIDKKNILYVNFFDWIAFNPVSTSKYVVSLQYSIYFMVTFISSGIISSIIISAINKYSEAKDKPKICVTIFIFLIFMLISSNSGINYFNIPANIVMYCIFFFFGYLSTLFKINKKQLVIVLSLLIIILLLIFRGYNYNIGDIQNLKMNNSIFYVLISFISLFVISYLRNRFSFNRKIIKPIIYLGKNAFYLFFAQGISSSILYIIEPHINFALAPKIVIMFLINISIALLLYFVLKIIYNILEKIKSILILKVEIKG